jgi:hypothetical protein
MGKLAVAGLVVLASTAGVFADLVTVSGSASGSGSASLSMSGSATLSGSGTYYSWVGWPTSAFQGVTLNFGNANPGFATGPLGIASSPTGSLTASLDPTDAPTIDAFTRLEHGSLDALNVDIKDGAAYGLGGAGNWAIGAYRADNGTQLMTLDLSAFSLAMTGLGFNMTGGPTGTLTSYSEYPATVSGTYSVAPYGNLTASLGTASLTTSLWNATSGWSTLGTYGIGGGSASQAEALSGTMVATELAGPYPRDVAITIAADTTAAVSVGFGASGNWAFNNYSGGTNPYYVVNVSTGVTGTATVNSAHVDLYSTLQDVIPEPMTLVVFGLGGAMLTLARRRSR